MDDAVVGPPAALQGEVEDLQLERQAEQAGVEHTQRLLEQLLPGLVALHHDYPQRLHAANLCHTRGRGWPGAAMTGPDGEICTWCGAEVEPSDGFRAYEPAGERGATFCRLEHIVPWQMQGGVWLNEPVANPGITGRGTEEMPRY